MDHNCFFANLNIWFDLRPHNVAWTLQRIQQVRRRLLTLVLWFWLSLIKFQIWCTCWYGWVSLWIENASWQMAVTTLNWLKQPFPPFAWTLSWSGLHLLYQVQPTATRLKSALNIAASFLNRFRAHHRKNVVCTWLATFSASSQEPGCSWKYEKIHSWSRGHGNKCDWMLGLRYWYMRL